VSVVRIEQAKVTYSDYLERGADAALLVKEERAFLHARD
jgi:hypothetical protein